MSLTEFGDLVSYAGRERGPWLLDMAWFGSKITAPLLAEFVGPVWCGAEYPDRALSWDRWSVMFAVAGYTVDGVPAARPGAPVRLYRAATIEHKAGHSWTADLGVARTVLEIRRAGGSQPSLWAAHVEPFRLLAAMEATRLGEPQFVIEADGLDIESVVEAARG